MSLNNWYEKGITPEAYIETLDKHEDDFFHIYNNFTVPNDDAFFQSIEDEDLRIILLAEPWCGHCMLDIPILFHIAEKANITVRILARDENLALMDQYLTNGKSRTIPIVLFIDSDGKEVAKWGPISDYTKEFTDKYRNTLPAKDSEDYDEKFAEMLILLTEAFRKNTDFWDGVYSSIKQVLEDNILNNKN